MESSGKAGREMGCQRSPLNGACRRARGAQWAREPGHRGTARQPIRGSFACSRCVGFWSSSRHPRCSLRSFSSGPLCVTHNMIFFLIYTGAGTANVDILKLYSTHIPVALSCALLLIIHKRPPQYTCSRQLSVFCSSSWRR